MQCILIGITGFAGRENVLHGSLATPRIGILLPRDLLQTYELMAYLSVRASQPGLKNREAPVTRTYSTGGQKRLSRIKGMRGNSELMRILLRNWRGAYTLFRPVKRCCA